MWEMLGVGIVVALVSGLVGFWLGSKRDERQYELKLRDEARVRWNNSVQLLKDFLSMLIIEIHQAEVSINPIAKRNAREKVLRGFPFKTMYRLGDGYKFGDDSEDAILVYDVFHNFERIEGALTNWHQDPSSKLRVYESETDPSKVLEIADETKRLLKFK
jgi:hypothetical protein